jgi:hypothetical protein
MDQLNSIGLDGKQVLNRLALANSLKAQGSNAQEREVELSSEDNVVVYELQIKDTQENNNVITILDDTGGQIKSLQLEQKPIDPIEQGKSAKDPLMEHVYQDGEKKEDVHNADGGKGHDKLKSRRPKLSFEELLAKYEKIAEANVNNRPKKSRMICRFINILDAKSKRKKVRVPKVKNDLPLSKIEIKPICSIGLPKWQEKKLQKLCAERLKEKGLAWVPKRRIQG